MPFISLFLVGVKLDDTVARRIYHCGAAHYSDRLAVDRRAAQVAVSKEVVAGLISIVDMAECLEAAVEIIVAVAAVKGCGVSDENIDALMLLYSAFQLFGTLPHLQVAVLISTQLTLAAAEARDTQALILDNLAVNIHAALGRTVEIGRVMVAMDVEQGRGNHGDKIAEIRGLQITT